ncbi:MAG: hypothetical protein DRH37_00760 [Deltaproteobacteria bacterium]|nr:MAG: hypothetical protein DRH37_00760 [Deltaproteobacteria bacterium]
MSSIGNYQELISELYDDIKKLEFENRLMDEALMQIAALPTQGGALTRQLIKDIQEQTENKEVSDD